jgi:two-component system CheB/CheR fusion protein
MEKIINKKETNGKKISDPTENTNLSSKSFPIVGIGASAGGLEALEQFFKNMPMESGMAFVVIQHLDPTHVGIMSFFNGLLLCKYFRLQTIWK